MSGNSGKIIEFKAPLVIAGAASGVGKTTVAIGLMGAFRRKGLKVAPFKVGPDYIDPGFHRAVTGTPSRNLDTWLTSPEVVAAIYQRGVQGADVAVVEGVMGLFDGRAGAVDSGSTAEVAGIIGGRVVLVVDCSRLSRSLAPVLAGFSGFDRDLSLAGAILNNVGSVHHQRMLNDAAREAGVAVLGALPRRPDILLESRHLGLVPAEEEAAAGFSRPDAGGILEKVIGHVEEHIDLDALLRIAGVGPAGGTDAEEDGPPRRQAPEGSGTEKPATARATLAVARDQAFSFYYQDSLEALEYAGASLEYFSPLHDSELPACDGIYLGGGFPEMFAAALEGNASMRASIAAAVKQGLPAYAECGGLIYLCRDVEVNGGRYGMCGALPLRARMNERRQALGYVEAKARQDSLLLPRGESIRGHEFHWSSVDWREESLAYDCYSYRERSGSAGGFSAGNLLASFVHVHFAGKRPAAERFIDACMSARGVRAGAATG